MTVLAYIGIIHKDSDFKISFQDLPGCTAIGATLEELIKNASEALQEFVVSKQPEEIPVPSSWLQLPKNPDALGYIHLTVEV